MNSYIPITQDVYVTILEASLHLPNCCYFSLLCANNNLLTVHEIIALRMIHPVTVLGTIKHVLNVCLMDNCKPVIRPLELDEFKFLLKL